MVLPCREKQQYCSVFPEERAQVTGDGDVDFLFMHSISMKQHIDVFRAVFYSERPADKSCFQGHQRRESAAEFNSGKVSGWTCL